MEDSRGTGNTSELASFVAALWAKRWWVIVGAAVSAAVAVVAVLVRTPQYEATARLAVVEYHVSEAAGTSQQSQTYAEIIRSQTVARDLVQEHDLGTLLDLTPPDLLERVSVQLVGNTSLIELTVELPDPELALQVTDGFARGAETLTRKINQADRDRAKSVLEEQFGQAEQEVDRVELAVAESGGEAALTALSRELDIYTSRKQRLELDWMDLYLSLEEQRTNKVADRLTEARATLTAVTQERRPRALEVVLEETLLQWTAFGEERDSVSAELAGERARLQQAEAELATKERLLDVTRTLGADDLLLQAERARRAEENTPLTLSSQYINPVFENLELVVSNARSSVEGLSQRLARLDNLVEEYADRAEQLERELADARNQVLMHQREADLALAEYQSLYEKSSEGTQSAIEVIEEQLAETDRSISDVQARFAARDARVRRLEAEYQAVLQVRRDLATRLESSEVTVANELAELMVVDEPILPETTSNTSGVLLVIAVTILGALLSLLLAAVAAGVEAVPPAD